MSLSSRRFAFAVAVVVLFSPTVRTEEPTPKQIAQWIKELGDDRFAARENASKQLWQAGAAAEAALEIAAKNDDAEVARRARDLLDRFHWGIYPDTPANIVALIRTYRTGVTSARIDAFQKLLDGGDQGMRAVLKIVVAEGDAELRKQFHDLIAHRLPDAFRSAVVEEKYEHFERLLELGHAGKFLANNQYAAYWLLRGKLKEILAKFQEKQKAHPDDKWTAQTLVYLHRANDDLASARKAAERSGDGALLKSILQEMGDWQALADLPFDAKKPHLLPNKEFEIVDAVGSAEKWAFRAAYQRLAGKQKEFETAVRELQKIAATKDEGGLRTFIVAKGMLLNDRPADGVELLKSLPTLQTQAFDILCARLQFKEAMALESKMDDKNGPIPRLDLARARALTGLGDPRGAAQFKRFGEAIKNEVDPAWIQALIAEEYRAGLVDLAFAHAVKAMNVAPPKQINMVDAYMKLEESYVAELFPRHKATAEALWSVLRRHTFKDESHEVVLKRLRDLLEGKCAAKEVKKWIEQAEPWVAKSANSVDSLSAQRQALAEVAAKTGLDDLAVSLLDKADSSETLLRLGDLLAEKKQWEKAAERYHRAWKKQPIPLELQGLLPGSAEVDSRDPLPLYLVGYSLVRAGREAEGKKLMQQAHWLPLADVAVRHRFLRALAERGHAEAARRETDLLRRVSEPNTYYSGAAIRRQAVAALQRKEYLKASLGLEQSMLRCLHAYSSFVAPAGYVHVPAQVHLLRARGLLEENKVEEALKQGELALDNMPGFVDVPIALLPALERLDRKKEATALFDRCRDAYEKVCRDYPRCAWAHNSLAWMSACCCRQLDEALTHAEKAVELAPTNAGYYDTLAEVHFQRGNKDKALAMQKRAIELDPKKVYYRKQMNRLEAGDPKAERPLENEED